MPAVDRRARARALPRRRLGRGRRATRAASRSTDDDPYAQCLTGMVWRALAILAEAGTTIEQTVSRVHRPKLASAGIRGWTWHQVEIVPGAAGPDLRAAGRHPRQPSLACPPRPLAPARGRAAGLRARLRGRRSRPRRGGQGLYRRGPRGMTDFTPSPAQAAAIREIRDWFENRTARAAGVPDVRLCRFRKEYGAALRARRARPRRRTRASATAAACPASSPPPSPARRPTCCKHKGTPARTIHSLIYSVLEATEEEVEAAAKKVARGGEPASAP